jgi:hypothetical protein
LLQNLLTSNPGLAAVFASKERLTPLFECLALPVPPESNIPQICLSVLSLLTKHAPCLEAMVAERTSLILLFQILHCNPSCRDGALAVLYSLASRPELAWAAAKHGGVVYILELILPLQGDDLYFVIFAIFIFLYEAMMFPFLKLKCIYMFQVLHTLAVLLIPAVFMLNSMIN